MKPKSWFSISNYLVKALSKIQTDAADSIDIYFCYRLLLGRKAESEGWQHWFDRVALGLTTRQLVKAFLTSREFRQKEETQSYTPVRLDDFVIYVDPDDRPIAESITCHKTYEPHVTAVLRKELQPEHVFLDIGCSIGWFTLLAASIVKSGKVIGIEPNHGNLQGLYRSLADNQFKNVIIFPYAATDRHTLLQLSSHAAYGFVHAPEGTSDDYVQGVTIDELLWSEPRIDIIKIDIEGHEPIALQGMQETINKYRPLVISEFHPKCIKTVTGCEPAEYLNMLIKMDYRLSVIEEDGNEVAMSQASEIIAYWQRRNEMRGTSDTLHLDLTARPL